MKMMTKKPKAVKAWAVIGTDDTVLINADWKKCHANNAMYWQEVEAKNIDVEFKVVRVLITPITRKKK